MSRGFPLRSGMLGSGMGSSTGSSVLKPFCCQLLLLLPPAGRQTAPVTPATWVSWLAAAQEFSVALCGCPDGSASEQADCAARCTKMVGNLCKALLPKWLLDCRSPR